MGDVTSDLKRRLHALRVDYGVPDEDPQAPWYHDWLIRAFEQMMKLL